MTDVPPGKYSFRFHGHSMNPKENDPYTIVGVGVLEVKADRTIEGIQKSNIARMIGQGVSVKPKIFTLKGHYEDLSDDENLTGIEGAELVDNMMKAIINFNSKEQSSKGEFAFVQAGGADRYWMISTTTKVTSHQENGDVVYDGAEVVSGELIRLA